MSPNPITFLKQKGKFFLPSIMNLLQVLGQIYISQHQPISCNMGIRRLTYLIVLCNYCQEMLLIVEKCYINAYYYCSHD